MTTYAWTKSAVEIVTEIDERFEREWNTDANIALLVGFIEEKCNPADFEAYVRAVAEDEVAAVAAAKQVEI